MIVLQRHCKRRHPQSQHACHTRKVAGMCALSDDAIGGLSLNKNISRICQTPRRPVLKAVNEETKQMVLFRPRCKQWSCPACGEINKALWILRTYHAVEVLAQQTSVTENNIAGELSFLTLTSHARTDERGSVAIFGSAWNKLRGRAAYAASGGQYLMMPERHKSGKLHVHAIETFNLGTRWWKDNAASCGLGYIAEEEIIQSKYGAANYVNKYLTKSIEHTEWPKHWRRVRTSQNWPKLSPLPTNVNWQFKPLAKSEQMSEVVNFYKIRNYDVKVLNHQTAWDFVSVDDTPV